MKTVATAGNKAKVRNPGVARAGGYVLHSVGVSGLRRLLPIKAVMSHSEMKTTERYIRANC
ncbi:MAG: hypothetical protein M3R67_03415 [Acidobacteriota bacterium]|nr:hypothetical protein [Acidobacteriota bacterium]